MSRCHRLSADLSPPNVSSPPQSSLGPSAAQTDRTVDPYQFIDDNEPGDIGTSLTMRGIRSSSRDGKPFVAGRMVC